jgi:hypothetical protein
MKLLEHAATVEGSGIDLGEAIDFSISKEGLPLLLNILRNKMYSNKPLAVIRELASNGFDAHVEIGKGNVPIKVTLPNDLSPLLKIRDYGKSLSPEEIQNVFVKYGASTKRHSNDYIGQMGIGAKAPFAYSQSFTITSYQGGWCRVYSAYIDPSQVGQMVQMGESLTEEPDGLEVIVPIQDADIPRFVSEAQKFFAYWKVRPLFEGAELTFPELTPLFMSESGDWIIPVKTSGEVETPVAIMGNVPYSLDADSIDWTGNEELRAILSTGVKLWVNIGELEVSASRESLEYTPQTNRAVISKLKQAQDALVAKVNMDIERAQHLYEAKRLYQKIIKDDSPLHELQAAFTKVTYRGKEVTSSYFECQSDGVNILKFSQGDKQHRASGLYKVDAVAAKRISCDEKVPVFFNDLGTIQQIHSRIDPLLVRHENALGHERKDEVIVVTVKDEAAWELWKKEAQFDMPMLLLSSLPKVSMAEIYPRGTEGSSGTVNPKRACNVFEYRHIPSEPPPHYRRRWRWKGRPADYWQPIEIDLENDEGVYVRLNKYVGMEVDNKGIEVWQVRFQQLGLPWPSRIIGLRGSHIKGWPAPPNMQDLRSYLVEQVRLKIAQTNPFNQVKERKLCLEQCSDFGKFLTEIAPNLQHPANGPLATFVAHYKEMLHEKDSSFLDSLQHVCSLLNISLHPDKRNKKPTLKYDFSAELRAIRKRYPILKAAQYELTHSFKRWRPMVQQLMDAVDNPCIKKDNYEPLFETRSKAAPDFNPGIQRGNGAPPFASRPCAAVQLESVA